MKIIMSYLYEDQKLKDCLNSLKKYSPEIEIIKLHSDPKVTKSSEHAFQKYFEEFGMDDDYMIWHPDMLATEGWLDDLKKYYDKFDIIGCKLLYPNGLVQHYGGVLFPGKTIAGSGAIGGHPHQYSFNIGLETPQSCPYVTGPGMVVKKHVYEKLKGWDHSMWCYIDADFCIRARKLGLTVGVVPVTLIHSEGEDQLKKRTKEENAKLLSEGCIIFSGKHMDYLSKFK